VAQIFPILLSLCARCASSFNLTRPPPRPPRLLCVLRVPAFRGTKPTLARWASLPGKCLMPGARLQAARKAPRSRFGL